MREAVETALDLLDRGKARVAERGGNGAWTVNQWLKKAVLLSFRLSDNGPIAGGAQRLDLVGQGADQVRGLGQRRDSRRRASAPCRAAWCGARPISRRAWS